jgi:hypothetical protein
VKEWREIAKSLEERPNNNKMSGFEQFSEDLEELYYPTTNSCKICRNGKTGEEFFKAYGMAMLTSGKYAFIYCPSCGRRL